MKQANIFMRNQLAGVLTEDETGYTFGYTSAYLASGNAEAISLTLQEETFHDKVLFPFFDGLIPYV